MNNRIKKEQGFSYIDVMLAIVIMMVGILALVSALTANMIRTYESERRIIAKQMALSTVESIISAKDISRVGVIEGWDSLKNFQTGLPNGQVNGIFLTGFRPVREDNGWDGVAGTVDDACDSGSPCAVSGRTTNVSPEIKNFQRKIEISDIEDPERPAPTYSIYRRKIVVTIRFNVNQAVREEVVSTIITKY
ncbi:MAG TPA: hypothetical protein PKY59_16285 [Pyrinomonadaceae bacterium]|nr:hypothetical protein [Pyrinomonadaceae bacterium]